MMKLYMNSFHTWDSLSLRLVMNILRNVSSRDIMGVVCTAKNDEQGRRAFFFLLMHIHVLTVV